MVVKIKNYLLLISVSFGFVIHAENMDNKVSFRYGFIGKKPTNLDSLFIVEDASTLNSGDQLRLNVDFEKGTFSVFTISGRCENNSKLCKGYFVKILV